MTCPHCGGEIATDGHGVVSCQKCRHVPDDTHKGNDRSKYEGVPAEPEMAAIIVSRDDLISLNWLLAHYWRDLCDEPQAYRISDALDEALCALDFPDWPDK